MEKHKESLSTLQVKHSSLVENMILQAQVLHLIEENATLREQVILILTTPLIPLPCSLKNFFQFYDDTANISGFLAQVTDYLTILKIPNSIHNATQVKLFLYYIFQQMEGCGVISRFDQSVLLKYENFVLEFQKSFGESKKNCMNPLVNAKFNKRDDFSQQDTTSFSFLLKNLSCNKTNQCDHFQGLVDLIQDEINGTNMLENLPHLVTPCIQLDRKHSHRPELLQSQAQLPVLASLIYHQAIFSPTCPSSRKELTLQGSQPLLTPDK
ncbi:LOW QUALITY PROTEIN: retrotransposon Gag-like protein 4 [Rhynchonycteris naso]